MSMNYIEIYDINDFQTIINSSIFISNVDDLLQQEIDANMWALSISQKEKKEFSLSILKKFIQDLIKQKKQQLKDINISHPVVFYMWFDEMASQLRFNIISYRNKKLPFGCTVNIVESMENILEKYLNDKGYISWDECNFFDKDVDKDIDEDEEEYILDVFVQKLN